MSSVIVHKFVNFMLLSLNKYELSNKIFSVTKVTENISLELVVPIPQEIVVKVIVL